MLPPSSPFMGQVRYHGRLGQRRRGGRSGSDDGGGGGEARLAHGGATTVERHGWEVGWAMSARGAGARRRVRRKKKVKMGILIIF